MHCDAYPVPYSSAHAPRPVAARVWIGLVAAAAPAGALVASVGARAPLQPLNAVAPVLVGKSRLLPVRRPFARDDHGGSRAAGSLVAWGILFSVVVRRRRGPWVWAAAFAVAAVVAVVDFVVLPQRLSPGFETMLTRGEVGVVYGVMAVSMAMAAGRLRTKD